ncbi:hypothetical protein [Tropicibacter naphthalenivorans]|uniref:Uncharacterized protein n=1 Tax=Tropicibacter naphthalenivorans TaxID=441103 RepID=A0A0P1G7J0_9RHOB|nr:hypothetical protein [Tropicibacter naphthalenivorans]CUH77588.1 hypothetical protein TRN7648_01554 [Tropicibacter naphthalenivorans]SMC56235.1 hypothetical protein SAMN04488093_10263 [Tropicibacter naphthalenivorans]
MTRNMFYRDFTLCKATALVGLMALAAALGGVPHPHLDQAGAEFESYIQPVYLIEQSDCDSAKGTLL